MKTKIFLNIALLAMTVCLGLTSCSKDEEDLIHSTFKSGDLYYKVTSNNTVDVAAHYDDSTGVTHSNNEISRAIIPHKVKYKGNIYRVTGIGNNAFAYNKNLTYVSIPNSVTTIWFDAFNSCTSLTSIELPNSITTFATGAFSQCINLESINIPTGVKVIPPDVFYSCHKLELPDIPGTVEEILSGAFYGCDYSRLSAINIPDGVKVIESGAFASAYDASSGVTSITIPNSVTEIGATAFNYHTNLKTIVLGKGLKKLSDLSFTKGAKNFNVYCLATTPPDQCPYDFRKKDNGVTVYIPKGSKDSYEAKDSDWRECNLVELDEEDFPAN